VKIVVRDRHEEPFARGGVPYYIRPLDSTSVKIMRVVCGSTGYPMDPVSLELDPPPGSALERPWVPYVGVVVFSLVTAGAIGWLTRGRRVNSDTAIGIFMVASFAWGIVAQHAYRHVRHGIPPAGWDVYLFGELRGLTPLFAVAAVGVCMAVVGVVALLGKEIVYYCFDPAMAEASGVRAAFVHYLLVVLVTLTIIVGVPVAGSILVTALLVLPGATALLLSDRLRTTVTASVVVGVAGAAAALLLRAQYPFFPMGPAIVLAMFVRFLVAYAWSRVRRAGQ
jgi:ABC-type Mn2+/Zn2+ transport system permease subunit